MLAAAEHVILTFYQTGKSLLQSKFKAVVDDKNKMAQMMKPNSKIIENTVGRGEYAGYQHFLLCPQSFQQVSSHGSLKLGILW